MTNWENERDFTEKARDGILNITCVLICRFMVGTEQGAILGCNRKAKSPAEKIVAVYSGNRCDDF